MLFDEESRTGIEVETIGEKGARRVELAHTFARVFGWQLEYGFHPLEAHDHVARRDYYELAPAYHLREANVWQLSLVDDFSVGRAWDAATTRAGMFRLLSRDPPVASFLARQARSTTSHEDALASWMRAWQLSLGAPFEGTEVEGERLLFDPSGVPVAARASYHEDRERVVELVTRPLGREERYSKLDAWTRVLRSEGFAPADDGALHFHFDAAQFQSTRFLRALVSRWNKERSRRLRQWEPRQESREFRGPFPRPIARALASLDDDTPFETTAAKLCELEPKKIHDWNIRGLVMTRPRVPTLEARFWNARTGVEVIREALEATEDFLRGLS